MKKWYFPIAIAALILVLALPSACAACPPGASGGRTMQVQYQQHSMHTSSMTVVRMQQAPTLVQAGSMQMQGRAFPLRPRMNAAFNAGVRTGAGAVRAGGARASGGCST